MPPRHWRLRVTDILECVASSEEYTRGLDYDAFVQDSRTVKAVVRDLTVIGEAAATIPEWLVDRYPEVPWADMRDMRDVVVHEYFGVDLRIVWDTVRNNLPSLVEPLISVLQDEPEDGAGTETPSLPQR